MKRNRLFCAAFLLLFIMSACGGSSFLPSPGYSSTRLMTGTITTGKPYRLLPRSFLGFSVELSDLCTILERDASGKRDYEQLYTSLGSGILRIGGHSADSSAWSTSGPYICSDSRSVITPELITALFAFAARIHWRVIWTLPLQHYDPAGVAREAASIAQIGGTSLLGFAIGNEPELYGKRSVRYAPSWNASTYLSEWEAEYHAVKMVTPDSAISGPDTSSIDPFFSTFVELPGTAHQVTLLTGHYYTSNASSESSPSITALLSTGTFGNFMGDVSQWMQAARSDRLPFALTEVNSISDSGVPGVSDTAAATFWLASVLLYASAQGVSWVGIQEAKSAAYDVIEDDGRPSVLYRALELVHQVITNAQLITVSGAATSSLQIMATRLNNGTIQLVLVNHDPLNKLLVPVTVPKGTKAQSLTTLLAPALDATSNVRLATESWSDSAPVQLNPESLAVLSFRPL